MGGSVEIGSIPMDLDARGLIRLWWKSNRTGFLVSAGLHGLLLLVFAVWALPRVLPANNFMLDGFSTTGPGGPAGPEGPIQINTKLTPADLPAGRGKSKNDAPDATNDKGSDTPGGGAVNPVAVGNALAGRGAGTGGEGGGGGGGGGGGKGGIWQGLGVGTKPPTGIASGLAWLAGKQEKKGGNWKLHEGYPDASPNDMRTNAGATALALLAFLGDGHTPTKGMHSKVVANGIGFLTSIQQPNGEFYDQADEGHQKRAYTNAMATIVLCETYALTGNPSLRQPCERAVKFLLDAQHPRDGGWKYRPQTAETIGDLSVTGWALMALHSARMAKIDVPIESFERASLFLDSVSEQNGSRYKYEPKDPAERVSPAMTAEGLLCRQWLGWPKDHPSQQDALKYLLSAENKPSWAPGRRNVYAWYYTAQTLHNVGGPEWQAWYQHTSQLILQGQVGGSWHPERPPGDPFEHSAKAGRLYLTCLCLLVLETPIRHAAIYPETDTKEKAP